MCISLFCKHKIISANKFKHTLREKENKKELQLIRKLLFDLKHSTLLCEYTLFLFCFELLKSFFFYSLELHH